MKKHFALMVIGTFSVANLLITSAAIAAGGYYYQEITYYSDATLSYNVGERTILCNGHKYTTGQVTPYYTIDISIPCD